MSKLHARDIGHLVATYYKLQPADMRSQYRARRVARPRQIAMMLSREFTALSTTQIGRQFGKRDHSTVCHACNAIRYVEARSEKVAADLRYLRNELRVMAQITSIL